MIQALWSRSQSPRLTYSQLPLLLSSDFEGVVRLNATAMYAQDKFLLGRIKRILNREFAATE